MSERFDWGRAAVLVTGGTGFIGRHLVQRLAAEAPGRLVVASRRAPESLPEGAEHVAVDLNDPGATEEVVGQGFGVVFHLAARTDHSVRSGVYRSAFEANTLPAINLLEAVRAQPKGSVRLIHVGTNAEYGNAPAPQGADSPERPNSAYGAAKLAASRAVLASAYSEGLPAVVARIFLAYGPGQSPNSFLQGAIDAAREGREYATTPGGQTRDFVSVEKICEDLVAVAADDSVLGGVVNICTGIEIAIGEALRMLSAITPRFTPALGAIPYRATELMRSVGVPYRPLSGDEARRQLREFLASAVAGC